MSELEGRLAAAIDDISLVDSHEHYLTEENHVGDGATFFKFLHYCDCDMTSAGMPWDVRFAMRESGNMSADEQWAVFGPYWEAIRLTGYGQALKIMAEDLFGAEIGEENLQTLNDNAGSFAKPGYFKTLLRERSNIATAMRIVWPFSPTHCDGDYLHPVPVFDHYATVRSRNDIERLEEDSGVTTYDFADLLRALDTKFELMSKQGMVGVKIFLAYKRILRFEQVARSEAETLFLRCTQAFGDTSLGFEETKPLQDYMVHQIIRRAMDLGVPIQIHTGYQNDNANFVANSRPSHLANLFVAYPSAKFCPLHGGYPYTGEFITSAKVFPNVYPDLAWCYIISPRRTKALLHELLDTVPANKILAFGGDYNFPEGSYAHAKMARRVMCEVLSEKVTHGDLSEDEAVKTAQLLFHDNAARLYGLDV